MSEQNAIVHALEMVENIQDKKDRLDISCQRLSLIIYRIAKLLEENIEDIEKIPRIRKMIGENYIELAKEELGA